ncbi:MAG: FAD-dependent oxidoreductase [Pseudomonadota bacterium]
MLADADSLPSTAVPQATGQTKQACGWYELAPPPPAPRRLQGAQSFDRVVIGGGFTGLACARRLAELEPNSRVALVEAQRIAAGNSGRNSGFLLAVSFYDDAAPAVQAARTRLQRAGLADLSKVVADQSIACDWQPFGNLYGAVSGAEEAHLAQITGKYRGQGEPLEDLSADQMASITGCQDFRRAIFHPGTVLVQPVKLVRGLAESLPGNVTLFEDSPAVDIAPTADGMEVRTRDGRIRSGGAYLCANGGAPALGGGRGRMLPVWTFAAMTPPLGNGGGPFGLLPCFAGGPTLRKTRDGRLLVRQGFAVATSAQPSRRDLQAFEQQARRSLAHYWPDLAAVPFDYLWGGAMVLTRNTAQVFGKLRANLYAAAFCNGAGNCSGTIAGRLLAEQSLGHDSELLRDQCTLPPPRRMPPRFLAALAARQQIAQADRRLRAAQTKD